VGEPPGQPKTSIAHKPITRLAGIGRRSPEPFDELRAGSAEGAPSSCWAALEGLIDHQTDDQRDADHLG